MGHKKLILSCLLAVSSQWAMAASTSAPGASVFIVEPADGATVSSPVTVKFGVKNMDVAPAGTDKPNSGHHHLFVDDNKMPAMDMPLPNDDTHQHFGKGQTETSLTLAPGKHTLQLYFGDKDHVPHNPALISKKITITVK